jgi:hypothetical protein
VQLISITNSPGSCNFKIGFNGVWSATNCVYHPAAGEMRTYLEAIATIGVGNIAVTKDSNWVYRCHFTGMLGGTDVPLMVGDSTGLPAGCTVQISVATPGGSGSKATKAAKKTAAKKARSR